MLLGDAALVDADHVGHAVAHRVHRVVRLVAMDRPVAGDARRTRSPASGPTATSVVTSGQRAAFGTQPPSVPVTSKCGPCMWIGWLVIVRLPMRMRTRSPVRATSGSMPGKTRLFQVHRLKSSHRRWCAASRCPARCRRRQQEHEVAVDLELPLVLRMDDEHAHHSHRHLHHLVGVRVVHVGARAQQGELVDEGLARRDVRLGQPADAVHARRQRACRASARSCARAACW